MISTAEKISFAYITLDEEGNRFGVVARGHEGRFSRLDSKVFQIGEGGTPIAEIIGPKESLIMDAYDEARRNN